MSLTCQLKQELSPAGAMQAADGDLELQQRLQDAWHAVRGLPADATLDAKVDAVHRLVVSMVRAFRLATLGNAR